MEKNIFKLLIMTFTFSLLLGTVFAASSSSDTTAAIIDVNLMSQDPDPVYAGDIVELIIYIENKVYSSYEKLLVEVD